MTPKISVVICAFNAERYLGATIESIIHQTYRDWELVIVDDGSRDQTKSIVDSYIKQGHPIRYHYQTNQGFGYSRNKVLELARGQWIAIIDHDDICLPERLETQIEAAERHSSVGFIFSNSEHFSDDGTVLRRQFDSFNPCALDLRAGAAGNHLLVHGCFVDSETAFFKREIALAVGGFDVNFRFITDYDFFIKMGFRCDFLGIPQVLSKWRVHPKQFTQTAREVVLLEHRRLYQQWSRYPGLDLGVKQAARFRVLLFALRLVAFYGSRAQWREVFQCLADVCRDTPWGIKNFSWFLKRLKAKSRGVSS